MPTRTCEICRYSTKLKTSFTNHMKSKRHEDAVRQQGNCKNTHLVCNDCEKLFLSRWGLVRHIRKLHPISEEKSTEQSTVKHLIQDVKDLKATIEELKAQLSVAPPTNTIHEHHHHEHNNIIVYLNKECTEAMSMTEE